MKKISGVSLLPLLLLPFVSLHGFGQSTAFTYQGQLVYKRASANGTYDLQFALYDAQSAGKLVAGPLTMNGVAVANGLLAIRLDFGAGIFTGAPRWMEIAVKPVGTATFSSLTPLQEITSSPYAIHAQTAANVANGAVTATQLNTGGVAPAPGQILSYNGGNLLWTDPGVAAGGIWSIRNNDAYYSSGNVGIGGLAGTSKLQITGVDALSLVGPGAALTWRDTATGRNAAISSAGGTLYYRVPDASGTTITAGYVDSNGSVVRGRLSLEGDGPFIIWNDSKSGKSASISSALGTLYYRVPDPAGSTVTAGYVDSNGSVVRGRLSLEPVGGGTPLATLDNKGLKFGAFGGQLLSLWSDRAFNRYFGIGIQDSTLYSRCGGAGADGFAWYKGGTHNDAYHDGGGGELLMTLDSSGLSVPTLTIRGGADLAEPFALSGSEIPKGSVVIIDPENEGKLMLSDKAYDQRVAGVVSGANGIHPGISLHQEGTLEGGENVALSGRVYVRADARHGSIKPGDLLTTSDTPGYAMKVTDHSKAHGAVLGKAMSGLKEGKGLILVLVTLQ